MSDSKDSTVIAPSVRQLGCDFSMVSFNGEHRLQFVVKIVVLWFCDALGQFVGNIHGSTKKVLKIQGSFHLWHLVASFWACKRAKPYPSNLWSSAQFHLQLLNPPLRWNLKDLKLQTENSNSIKQIAISIFVKKNHILIHGCVVQSCWISFLFGWSPSVWKSSRPRTRIGDQPQGRTNLIQQFQTHVEDLLVVCESAVFFWVVKHKGD